MISWPEFQAELERLAAEGLSAGLIAEKIGVTKNAVIGRCHRTGVKLLEQPYMSKGKKMGKTTEIDGLPVKDASKKLAVYIDPVDVSEGAKKNSHSCAAARAICRSGKYQEARVHVARTYVKDGNKWLRFVTPPALRSEIIAFDRGGAFEPGNYALLPPSGSEKIGARAQRKFSPKPTPKGRTVKKREKHVTTGIRKSMGSE